MTIQLLSLTTALLLFGAPPNLEAAIDDAHSTDDLFEAALELEATIEAVRADPNLLAPNGSVDPQLLESLALLASLYIAVEDRSRAGQVIDILLRLDPREQAPIRSYGPALFELHQARRAALVSRGQATLEVVCHSSCEVIVDGHRQQTPLRAPVSLGPHIVWVRASGTANSTWEQHELSFSQSGAVQQFEFGAAPIIESPLEQPAPRPDPAPSTGSDPAAPATELVSPKVWPPPRPLPRGLEITGLVVGATALATGVALLFAHGRCEKNWSVAHPSMNPELCGDVWNTYPAAMGALAGFGGALALASSITLGIDEQRVAGKRGTQYSLSYRIAF